MALPIMNSAADVCNALREAIAKTIPDARVTVNANSPGHYEIEVISTAFEGKSMLQGQQIVYAAIKDLMAGDNAPVHAVDRLKTKAP